MTTTIPARNLTVDHHGLFATIVLESGAPSGTLVDTLIGEELVDIWLETIGRLTVARDQLVELRQVAT